MSYLKSGLFLATNSPGSRDLGASEGQAEHEWLSYPKTHVKIKISFSDV